jgi:hypothetical protein
MKTKHPPWFKQSKIIHFDRNRPFEDVSGYVSNPENIAKHAFYPFIRFYLPKKIYRRDEHKKLIRLEEHEKREREISYASHLDSNIFSFYAEKLTDKYENLLENENCGQSVIAYRKDLGKSNVDFARDAFVKVKEVCEENQQDCIVAICYDIEDFYGSLDHKILKEKLCEVLQTGNPTQLPKDYFNIYKAMTKFSWVEEEKLLKTLGINKKWLSARDCFCQNAKEFREKVRANQLIRSNENCYGIPQGSSISPVFSNIYMLSFDREMTQYAEQRNAFYLRYSDDILWLCLENSCAEDKEKIESELRELRLEVNGDKKKESRFKYDSGKIENVSMENGTAVPLEYLGFSFDGKCCFLRNKTLSNYYIKMSGFITRLKRLAAYSKQDCGELYVCKIYRGFSHLAKKQAKRTNFILYALEADKKFKEAGLRSGIRHQIRKHWDFIHRQIKKEKRMEVEAVGFSRTEGKNKEGKDVDFIRLYILRAASTTSRKELTTTEVGKIPDSIYVEVKLLDQLKAVSYPCTIVLKTEEKIREGQIVREVTGFEQPKPKK